MLPINDGRSTSRLQSCEVKTLTLAVPLKSRHAKDVTTQVSHLYCRLKSMNLPVTRVHVDRAKEFISHEFQQWIQQRDLWVTTTAADEPQSNGRAEAAINQVKRQARAVLSAAKAPTEYWPLAVRHVSEVRFRQQLAELGAVTSPILPFGVSGWTKRKLWQDRYCSWKPPFLKVRVWGPATQMSCTSNGYMSNLQMKLGQTQASL